VAARDGRQHVELRRDNASLDGAKELRILVLGASIMSGSQTKDENGFRKVLRDQLVGQGFTVNYVGNRIGGSMLDNALTAWGGFRIDEVAQKGELSYAYQPNVVLLQCGSNDFFQNFQIATASNRFEALVDRIHEAVPDSLVVVSTLLPNFNSNFAAKFSTFDGDLKAMAAKKIAAGEKVSLADFTTSEYSTKDIRPPPDGTHPTDAGYVKMGGTYYKAILAAQDMITAPRDNGIPNYDAFPQTSCAATFNQTSVLTQQSYSGTPGDVTKLKGDGVRFCDMFGNKADDYLWMSSNGSLTLFGNTHSPPNWKEYGIVHDGGIAPRDQVHLTDLDGDGLCDYVVVSKNNGTLQWQKNLGYNGSFSWGPLTSVNKTDSRHLSPVHCEWGSEGVYFADTTGSGETIYQSM
jgi:lysophospholipase L1-like esterase